MFVRELQDGCDVEVVLLDDPGCVQMMRDFIAAHPDLWNEDIGVD